MKIIYYSPHPNLILNNPSGYGTHMREMIKAFEEAGHTILPVIMGGIEVKDSTAVKPNFFKEFLKKVIPTILWETLKDRQLLKFDLMASGILETAIKNFAPDIIYERGNYMQISGGIMAKKYGVKNILEINAPYVEERRKYQGKSFLLKLAQKNEKIRAETADKIVVVSSPLKKYLVSRHEISESKIIITPNAIDTQKLNVIESKKEEVLKKYGLNGKFIIGFVGSIAKWHGVEILIQSFVRVKSQIPNSHLLIVGGGETMEDLKKLTESLGVISEVSFTGNVKHEEVFTYISLMDLTVLPRTNWYMSPIKIFEYGAMGKSIIAPDNDPVKDVMINYEDGLLVEPNKVSIGDAILHLFNNPELKVKVAQNFKEKVLSNYTWKKTAERILTDF